MTISEQIAGELVTWISGRVNLTTGTREEIKQRIAASFEPHIVTQGNLEFSEADMQAHEDHREKILALLKQRRSEGATNVELSKIALRFGGRIHELRRDPHFYRILCKKESRGVFRYKLSPECY